jgi:DNA sulfur modification protein DndD
MILDQLTLENFCLYRGRQEFDLTPSTGGGRHRPIVLFGGINGGGKTTLLDALQLALYGPRARCSKRNGLAYDEFLRRSVHSGVPAGTRAGVTLSFRYSLDGREHLYDVRRTWSAEGGKVRENLKVYRDGEIDNWVTDNWPQLVEELFPLDIAQLFFFDAEKIRTLAEDESSSRALEAAIKSLLALGLVDQLF